MDISTTDIDYPKYVQVLSEALGQVLYEDVLFYLKQVLEAPFDYKLFMSRKAYCLFKIFVPVLKKEKEEEPKSNNYNMDNVLSDRSLLLSAFKFTPDSSFLIVDDSLRYGRSVAKIADILRDVVKVKAENIQLSIFAVLNQAYHYKKGKSFARIEMGTGIENDKYLLVYNNTLKDSDNPEERRVYFYDSVEFYDSLSVKGLHHKFVEAVHAVGESYSSYMPNYYLSYDDAFRIETSPNDAIEKGYEKEDFTLASHRRYGVTASYYLPKDTGDDNTTPISGFRLFSNKDINRASLTPVISHTNLNIEEAYKAFTSLIDFKDLNKRLAEYSKRNVNICAAVKHSVILHTYGHIAAHKFLHAAYSGDEGSNLRFNVSGQYTGGITDVLSNKELNDLDMNMEYDFTGVFSKTNANLIYEDEQTRVEFNALLNKADAKPITCGEEVFAEIFNELKNADNTTQLSKTKLSTKYVLEYAKDMFNQLKLKWEGNIKNRLNYWLVKTYEQGIAGTRIETKKADGKLYTVMCAQEGEEADIIPCVDVSDDLPGLSSSIDMVWSDLNLPYSKEERTQEDIDHMENIRKVLINYLKSLDIDNNNSNNISPVYRINCLFNQNRYLSCAIGGYRGSETQYNMMVPLSRQRF